MSSALSRLAPATTAALAALVLTVFPAQAQELGLDLSEGPELRPTLIILGIGLPKDVSAPQRAHADKLAGALVVASRKTGWFAKVLDPADAVSALKDGTATALSCDSAECLSDLARHCGADRVLTAQMAFPAGGPTLKLWGYDPGTGQVEEVMVQAQGKPAGFDRSVAQAFRPMLQTLAVQLGTLKVVPNLANATVEVSGRILGTGTVEKQISAGHLKLRITAPNHQPFEKEVSLDARGSAEVLAQLVPNPPPVVDAPPKDPEPVVEVKRVAGKPFYERPGLYLALAGAAAAGVGGYFGWAAKDMEKKAQTPGSDGIVPITRSETSTAKTYALLANVLIGAGAAVVTGGTLWFALEPAPPTPGAKVREREPTAFKGETIGFLFTVGGEL
ncbi:MAG: PEGA domain-containing protein [Deltaproteobacteria bacterium]|nr:PEGA domain-containing protein [Deltaproteobacteria bacterium]